MPKNIFCFMLKLHCGKCLCLLCQCVYMGNYRILQNISYALILTMLLFNFWSMPIYQEEIDSEDIGDATIEYYLDEIKLEDEFGTNDADYKASGFSEMEDIMENLNNLSLLLLLLSAFLAWKIKEVLEGGNDFELVRNLGFGTSIVAILFFLYSIYAIPTALEDDWKGGLFDEGDGFNDYEGMFMGEQTFNDPEWGQIEFESGPGNGWYLIALCGAIGINLFILTKNLDERLN